MSRWHNHYLDQHAHFCTSSVRGRHPALVGSAPSVIYAEWEAARRLLDVRVLAYVIMPDHIHIVLWATSGANVRAFLQQTLSLTARRLQSGRRFWKERPRVVAVYSEQVLKVKVDYVHGNPVRAGLAQTPADWLHSSYRQLEQGESVGVFTCDGWDGLLRQSRTPNAPRTSWPLGRGCSRYVPGLLGLLFDYRGEEARLPGRNSPPEGPGARAHGICSTYSSIQWDREPPDGRRSAGAWLVSLRVVIPSAPCPALP